MNICILTSSFPSGPFAAQSAGVFVRDFALALAKNNNRVFVVTQALQHDSISDPELEVVRYNCLAKEKPLSILNPLNPVDIVKILSVMRQGKKALFRLLMKERIDFCLAMWTVPSGYFSYCAKRKHAIPYAVWALGSDIWKYGKYPLIKLLVRRILQYSDSLYADGIRLCNDVERLAKRKCTFLATTRILPKQNIASINLDRDKLNYLYIGRYHRNKGVDILIDAISNVPYSALGKMHFYIFGGGVLECEIKSKVLSLGLSEHVTIGGFLDSNYVAAYLSACDCLIIPSRIESIPCVLSDALQMNKPVIVSDVGDMGELVRKYEVGIVANANSSSELSKAIVKFSMDDSNKFSNGILEMSKMFNLENIVSQFDVITKNCINNKGN